MAVAVAVSPKCTLTGADTTTTVVCARFTTWVAAERAGVELPPALMAMTSVRIVLPTSATVRRYVF
ncbi:MAG: hypothetical protein CVU47_08655 [Chloroflexi bacterium HGW-Chloroflexi-9]|nr:MAG: hypothetical protein CVU47_08655 [Chloroflexi bacterium HGW-Chloroflexi-9]